MTGYNFSHGTWCQYPVKFRRVPIRRRVYLCASSSQACLDAHMMIQITPGSEPKGFRFQATLANSQIWKARLRAPWKSMKLVSLPDALDASGFRVMEYI